MKISQLFKHAKNVDSGSSCTTDNNTQTCTTLQKSINSDHSSRSSSSDTSSSYSLALSETRQVLRSKSILLGLILASATICGLAVYLVVSHHEMKVFEEQFNDFAIEIADVSHEESFNIFRGVHSMSTDISSLSQDGDYVWPNITIPHFEKRGYGNNHLTLSLQLSLAVLVPRESRIEWEHYSEESSGWLEESYNLREIINANSFHGVHNTTERNLNGGISPQIQRFENYVEGNLVVQDSPGVSFGPGAYAPVWQQAPAPTDPSIINFDLLSHPSFSRLYHGMWETKKPVLSEALNLEFLYGGAVHDDIEHPHSFLLSPVYPMVDIDAHGKDDVVAFLVSVLGWDTYFSNLLPESITGIVVVLNDSCGDHFTYLIDGPDAIFVGEGDQHESQFDSLELITEFAPFLRHNFSETHEHCEYNLRIYPSGRMEQTYLTHRPKIYSAVVIFLFFFVASVFIIYDIMVSLRNGKVMKAAKAATAVVSAIFPQNVCDRIMKEAEARARREIDLEQQPFFKFAPKAQLKDFVEKEREVGAKLHETAPIADLYACATVMSANIVGFTAWASAREPSQIFTFLETIFRAFDVLAKRRRIFKVETVGECYTAVCGIPTPRKDHAVVIARYALDCQRKFNDLTKILEVRMGPDTGDLSLSVGLHSGPVTAGVLRGDKSRFQLFGSTVNALSFIVKSSFPNRIHMSKTTADLISSAGKSHWLIRREGSEDLQALNGMQTYWLELKINSAPSRHSCSNSTTSVSMPSRKDWIGAGLEPQIQRGECKRISDKTQRIVDWSVSVLVQLLIEVVAHRSPSCNPTEDTSFSFAVQGEDKMVIDEVVEVIELPKFDTSAPKNQVNRDKTVLDPRVITQLQEYVTVISKMYHNNPFHNFEHALHVAMSVGKLLNRIVAPDYLDVQEDNSDSGHNVALSLHDHTFGITSDPLTRFACLFAAIIHDVDHQGIPNAQLIKEAAPIAIKYKGKSVAEQNSVDVAWGLLMAPQFLQLRDALFCNIESMKRFRELVVNCVMATDIVDPDLKQLRNARWEMAFNENLSLLESPQERTNRKATIVIEHLIQASDVAHTMQHWNVYRRWNEMFFHENYKAFRDGRAARDPSEFWYQGEICFFDYYIIPLAMKLKECGVFGVSSDEYLNYAKTNRKEWAAQGEGIVAEMVEKFDDMYKENS